jgi:hypothetical protein
VKNITEKKKFIKQGILGDRTVYAIPHYASRLGAYFGEKSVRMGKSLSEILL